MTVKDAEKAVVAAEGRVAKVIADGDEAAITLLQAAEETRKTETATLADLNEVLSQSVADVRAAEEPHVTSVAAEEEATLTLKRSTKEAEAAKAHLQHTVLVVEYARAAADDESTRTRLSHAAEIRDAAIAAAEAAQAHLAHVQRADLAATLRTGLRSGDSCPVCEAAIEVVPKTKRGFVSTLKTATASAADAGENRLAAERDYASRAAACTSAADRLSAAVAALPKAPRPIRRRSGSERKTGCGGCCSGGEHEARAGASSAHSGGERGRRCRC